MQNILFIADNHFGARPGFHLWKHLRHQYSISFHEEDWSVLDNPRLSENTDLLILNMIYGTGKPPPPSDAQAGNVLAYLSAAKPLLILHGASAAFWPYTWWRRNVGMRWIRNNDPDQASPSIHPIEPFSLECNSSSDHPLSTKIVEATLPKDELYIELAEEQPVQVLLQTHWEGKTYPQAFAHQNEWGGEMLSYLPGHREEVATHPSTISNISLFVEHLLNHQYQNERPIRCFR